MSLLSLIWPLLVGKTEGRSSKDKTQEIPACVLGDTLGNGGWRKGSGRRGKCSAGALSLLDLGHCCHQGTRGSKAGRGLGRGSTGAVKPVVTSGPCQPNKGVLCGSSKM